MTTMIEHRLPRRNRTLLPQSRRKWICLHRHSVCPSDSISIRAVIMKLLGFTAAMVGGPIGMYFLTLNTVFRGQSSNASKQPPELSLSQPREFHVGWCDGRVHGEPRPHRLCHRCNERGPKRPTRSWRERQEEQMTSRLQHPPFVELWNALQLVEYKTVMSCSHTSYLSRHPADYNESPFSPSSGSPQTAEAKLSRTLHILLRFSLQSKHVNRSSPRTPPIPIIRILIIKNPH